MVTWSLIAACVCVWAVEVLLRVLWPSGFAAMLNAGMVMPLTMVSRPWTWLTSMFMHAPSPLHILFNMIALWSVGPMLERMMGHLRFLALYLISGLGGSVGLLVWARLSGSWLSALYGGSSAWLTPVYGASGALFGLFAAVLVVYRRVGEDIRSMLVWMAVNFLMPFVVGGIAWQSHAGGFVTGGVLTWLLVAGVPAWRRRSFTWRMCVYGVAVVAVLLAVTALCAPPVRFSLF